MDTQPEKESKPDSPPPDEGRTCRFAAVETRIDDLRSNFHLTLTIFASLLAGGLAALALMGYLFRSDYKDFKDTVEESVEKRFVQIEERVGVRAGVPEIEAKTTEGLPLDGAVIPVKVSYDGNGRPHIGYMFQFWNVGSARTGPVTFKHYYSDPLTNELPDDNFSTDEPEYDYGVFYIADESFPDLPPRFSFPFYAGFRLTEDAAKGAEINSVHNVMMKLYYGNGLVSEFRYRIRIVQNLVADPG